MISSKWLQWAKTPEDRKKVADIVTNSTTVLGLLETVLQRELEELTRSSLDDYSKASWPYWRADRDGQIRQIKNILTLVTLKGDHP